MDGVQNFGRRSLYPSTPTLPRFVQFDHRYAVSPILSPVANAVFSEGGTLALDQDWIRPGLIHDGSRKQRTHGADSRRARREGKETGVWREQDEGETRRGRVAEVDFATRTRLSSSTEADCGHRMGRGAVEKDGKRGELVGTTGWESRLTGIHGPWNTQRGVDHGLAARGVSSSSPEESSVRSESSENDIIVALKCEEKSH
ncbi:hypothetical protein ARMGADRAFT_1041074, partial [Armillaria gallica]